MKGTLGFLVGLLLGAAATIGVCTFVFPFASPLDKILDLRAQVEEQAREIEILRRELSAQIAATDPQPVVTAMAPPRPGRPVSPPFASPSGARPTPDSMSDSDDDTPPALSRQTLELDYADLITTLQLTAAQRLAFLDLLTRRSEPGGEAALRAFFSSRPADYVTLQTYRRQLPEHRRVRDLRASLERIARPLTPDEETALLAIFGRERKALRAPTDVDAADQAIAADPAAAPRLLQNYAQMNLRIAERASKILSPEQIAVLRELQANEFQRLQIAAQMARPSAPPRANNVR